jgi:predicted transcriptional regulator
VLVFYYGVLDLIDVLSLLAAVGGLGGLVAIVSAIYWLGRKFGEIDERFRAIDERFKLVDEKFKMIDERFQHIDERFKQVDKRFDELESRILGRLERLASAFTYYHEFFLEVLSREGVIKSDIAEVLAREARRVVKLAMLNPLTKEEWEKIKEYLDKSERGELTLEEADEFLELARKVVKDYGEYAEAWKLHMYATIVRALLIKKLAEKKRSEEKQ